jgi:transposase
VLEPLKERERIQQIASRFEVHPNQVSQWKRQFIEGADTVFEGGPAKAQKHSEQVEERLYKKFGHLQVQLDFLKKLGEGDRQCLHRVALAERQSRRRPHRTS